MNQLKTGVENFNTISQVEKKIAILIGGRFMDQSKISKSLLNMEKIRKRLTAKVKGFNGIDEIRKWRDIRCKY